ncbi:MAG: tRNA (adenosine(37)-N6)-dimethylallyltransferase MiaA [Acidimicrobiales bacterium]
MLDPLVIVGPTATGKSALALALAQRTPGAEIVSADALAVYRGMDVGTAKPTVEERAGIIHHLIDIAEVDEEFTVSRFQDEANAALATVADRGGVPIVVGGTGLYVRAVVDDFSIPGQYPEVRAEIEQNPSTRALWERLDQLDPIAAAKMEPSNRRRIVRALEVSVGTGQPFSSFGPGVDKYPPSRFRQVGLRIDRADLDRRIDDRYDAQLEAGFLDEVERLATLGLSRTAAQGLGYRELLDHLAGNVTFDEAMAAARQRTRRFARRQERWFRRDPRIAWFDADDEDLVAQVDDWWRKAGGMATG